jgi:two-component system, cell cycle sensor histidine kinase and response regulator CckA
MTVFDIDPTGQPSSQAAFLEKLCAAGSVVFESIHRRKDGSTFPVEVSIKYVQLDKSYLVTVARDIADRKKSQAA